MDVLRFQYDPIYGPDPDEYNPSEEFSRMVSPVSFSIRALEPWYLNIQSLWPVLDFHSPRKLFWRRFPNYVEDL